jgi:maleate cis-trans isomerase
MRAGNLEELIRVLPVGISVIPLFNDIRDGSRAEFEKVIAGYEAKTAQFAAEGIELVHPAGAPPFMILGYEKERLLVLEWERKYGVEIFTSGMNHVAALRALDVKRFVGVSYFRGEMNATFGRYFTDAGFDVLAMAGMDVDFDRAQNLSSHEVYAHTRETFLKHPGADGIYMLGSGWKVTDIVQPMEDDFGVPVIHAQMARLWAIQNRLHVRQPRTGFGRLLAEHPPQPMAVALAG